jgi:hypothetical protein
MSAFTIPNSSAVVTQASHPSVLRALARFSRHLSPLLRRLECLDPGALPGRTNAPAGWCCRWAPSCRRQAALSHWKEACDAQVS